MIQLKVYPTSPKVNTDALFIDLYESEPIKLNLSIEDVTSADATSAFSRVFKVPATRHNNEFFENAYLIEGVTYDITVKKPAEILVDGAEFKTGHVRLQKIYVNDDLDRVDYELLFLGETRDFSSIIADKPLCQLVMTDFSWPGTTVSYADANKYTGPYSYTNQSTSWDAFPEGSITSGYANGNILFPLIDHGNTYDDTGNPEQGVIHLNDSTFGFTNQNKAIANTRLKPMIRLKRVIDQIFEDSGYTYESEFFDSDRFKQIYISAFGNNEQIGMEIEQTTTTNFQAEDTKFSSIGDYLTLTDSVYNPGSYYHISGAASGQGSYFELPATAVLGGAFYIMSGSAEVNAYVENSNYTRTQILSRLELWAVNGPGITGPVLIQAGNWATNLNTTSFYWDSRNGGFQPQAGVELQIKVTAQLSTYDYDRVENVYWDCTAAPGQYYLPQDLDCDYKQIDLVKDILTAFRLVMQPDIYKPNHFIVEPWQDFIGSGDTYDWSDKLVNEKDFIIEPLFNTQSATIEFSMKEDKDYINEFHQNNYKHPYGWLQFDSNNELLKGERKVELQGISPTPLNQIEQKDGSPHSEPTFVLPQIHKHEQEGGNAFEHVPIKSNTRLLFYNGLQPILDSSNYWYIEGYGIAQEEWPLVSSYENWPVTSGSLNLNFYNDIRYYLDPSPGTGYFDQGSTLYDEYWSRYINSLYNKFSRRVTAYFVLNNVDLQNLTFDDLIFVNGVYYRPEKIIDAQVGEKTAVKCQLITVRDAKPKWAVDEQLTNFTAVGVIANCPGGNGTIDVTTDGTPEFTWELDNGMTGTYNAGLGLAPYNFTIDDVPAGTYTLTVTDSVGREYTQSVTILPNANAPVTYTVTGFSHPTVCDTPCNGTATINFQGGTPTYTVYWNDGTVQTSSISVTRTDLCPGEVTFYVEDGNGCISSVGLLYLVCNEPVTVGHTWAPVFFDPECNPSLGVNWEYTADLVAYAPGTRVTLSGKSGCYELIGQPPLAPTTTVLTTGETCLTCSVAPPQDYYEVVPCDGSPVDNDNPIVVDSNGFVLNVGMSVTLASEEGTIPVHCYEVVGITSSTPTDTVGRIYDVCFECNNNLEALYLHNERTSVQTVTPVTERPGLYNSIQLETIIFDPDNIWDASNLQEFMDVSQTTSIRARLTGEVKILDNGEPNLPDGVHGFGIANGAGQNDTELSNTTIGWPTFAGGEFQTFTVEWDLATIWAQTKFVYPPFDPVNAVYSLFPYTANPGSTNPPFYRNLVLMVWVKQ